VLERASAIEGFTKVSELEFLCDIAGAMPDGASVVEIGSFKGRSTVAICEGIGAKPGVTVWAVDTFAGDSDVVEITGGPVDQEAVEAEFARNTAGYDFLRVIVAESVAAAEQFDRESLDWVFIDADHSYEAVVADIAAWAPKLKPGGLLSGHDYGRAGVTDAVRRSFRAVDQAASIWYTRERPRPQYLRSLKIAVRRALPH
jgi:predicted O-methyltransferase YrrM